MLDIVELLEKKRKEHPVDSDYIEELERMLLVTDEAYYNVERENISLRTALITIGDFA